MILLKTFNMFQICTYIKIKWIFMIFRYNCIIFFKHFLGYILFILRLLMRQQMFTIYLSHYIFVRKYWRTIKANKHYQDFGYDCPYHTPIKNVLRSLSYFSLSFLLLDKDCIEIMFLSHPKQMNTLKSNNATLLCYWVIK